MKSLIEDMESFNRQFGMPINKRSMMADPDWLRYRMLFLAEELEETAEAAAMGDVHDLLDGLIDLIYVAVGTGVTLGLPMEEAWNRVHAANMAKVRVESAESSKRGHSLDLRKPDGWTAPSFDDIL